MILLLDRLFVGVGVFFFSVFQCSINVGFDFPKHLGFFTEILECCIVGIVLLFQFCILGLDRFAVVFSVRAILGEQTVGGIELIQGIYVFVRNNSCIAGLSPVQKGSPFALAHPQWIAPDRELYMAMMTAESLCDELALLLLSFPLLRPDL